MFPEDTKLGGAAIEGANAIQRNLGRFEKWTSSREVQYGQVQGAVPGLGQPSGSEQTGGSMVWEQPHGEGLGDTGGDKLDMSWQRALTAQKANFVLSLQVDPPTSPPLQ